MKAIKSLLAVSVLVAAGAANAATIDTYSLTGSAATGASSTTFTGTGVLDDSGTLTLSTVDTTTASGMTMQTTSTSVYSGSLVGGVFTATSGTVVQNTCTNISGILCAFITTGGAPVAYNTVSGSVTQYVGGNLTTTQISQGQTNTANLTLTSTTPAVPVPAAAWLFGSGLLGLAGTARRRKVA